MAAMRCCTARLAASGGRCALPVARRGPSLSSARSTLVAQRPALASARHLATSFAGLSEEVDFTNEVTFRRSAGPINPLRLVGEDGKLVPGATLPFTLDEALGMYRTMLRVSVVDQLMNSLQRQGRISFYMTGTGEEAAQVGTLAALDFSDVVWPQYRELGALMHRGFSIQQVVDQCMGRKDDPGKGRQMPVHYCDAPRNFQAVTSPLATQIPQAVGAGYAYRMGGEQRCGVAFFGDGAASEGDFAVALNFAATLQAQVLFLCRNNGWAISTPAKEQYAGDGIAVRGIAYGVDCIRVDGNDLAAVYLATQRARELCVQGKPVIVEMMTYRRGHHSTSDDATRYRGGTEVKTMAKSGLEPISRTRLMLEDKGLWSQEQEDELREETRLEIMSALKTAEAKKFAPVSDMFEDVWEEMPERLRRQREELFEHVARHPENYRKSLAQFEGN